MVTSIQHVRENIERIRERIAASVASSGRPADSVGLMAVTKYQPLDLMREAMSCKIDCIGENRVQEAQEKRIVCGSHGIPWCMTGHLQRNKTRKALEIFNAIHSIDNMEVASAIERILAETGKKDYPILVEVNCSGETSKSGTSPDRTESLVCSIMSRCTHISVLGFMTIGPMGGDTSATRTAFRTCMSLAREIRRNTGLPLPTMSMGMSGDYEIAIEEGSTLVRVGTAIFGERTA